MSGSREASWPLNATERGFGPFGICNLAVVVSEVELPKIPLKVALSTMLINTLHSSFENTEKALDGVCVDLTTDIFVDAMPASRAASTSSPAHLGLPLAGR